MQSLASTSGVRRRDQNDRTFARCLVWMAALFGASTAYTQQPELVTQFGHSGAVTAIAIAPDNSFIVTGGDDETVLLWDIETGRQVRQFTVSSESIDDIDVSADSSTLLTVQGGQGLMWNIESGELTHRILGKKRQTIVDRVFFGETHGGTDANPFRDPIDGAKFIGDSMDIVTTEPVALWRAPYKRPYKNLEFIAEELKSNASGAHVVATAKLFGATVFDTRRKKVNGRIRTPFIDDAAVFASGEKAIVATRDGVALYDVKTGTKQQDILTRSVDAMDLSLDNTKLAVADTYGIRIFDMDDIENPVSIRTDRVDVLSFSDDGRLLLTAGRAATTLWDVQTATILRSFGSPAAQRIEQTANSVDGRFLATSDYDDGIWIWDLHAELQPRYVAISDAIQLLAFVRRDGMLIAVHDESVTTIDSQNRRPPAIVELQPRDDGGMSHYGDLAAVSEDGRLIAKAHIWDNDLSVFDLESGRLQATLTGHTDSIKKILFSPDASHIATAARDSTVRLWNARDGELEQTLSLDRPAWFDYLAFSDDATVVTIDGNHRLVYALDGAGHRELLNDTNVTRLSADGSRAATAKPIVFDVATGRKVLSRSLNYYYTDSVLSRGGRWLFSEHAGGATLWDVDNQSKMWEHQTAGHSRAVFLNGPFSERIAAIVTDGAVELLEFRSGERIARLIGERNGIWNVITDEGRFDTNNIDETEAIDWVLPSNRMKPLPVELFMREYFQPDLLRLVLSNEPMKTVPDIGTLNILQPKVEILRVDTEPCAPPPCTPTTVAVDVRASSVAASTGQQESGVFDLRLFRNGRLVDYTDGVPASETTRFTDVQLPRLDGQTTAEFTAYAFNSDRVKSSTANYSFNLPRNLGHRSGTVFIVSVGVNNYDNPDWNLTFAADDAREMSRILFDTFDKLPEFEDVVPIALLSDDYAGVNHATKPNVRRVLDVLSGRVSGGTEFSGIENSGKLRKARPEDLVLIVYSSHGYADGNGSFFLFPSDIGSGQGRKITDALLAHTISDDDLAAWLRNIDAGDLVLVIDACHSAASVEGSEFKPGPMGSRGLGQLAYDKGMRVLAATQADRPAYETSTLQHGLLTYTLLQRGLISNEADFFPQDGRIFLSEWLSFAPARMRQVYGDIKGNKAAKGVQHMAYLPEGDLYESQLSHLQQPSLFDFAKHDSMELKRIDE